MELQKQPVEINRELKFARVELDLAKCLEESISGDCFATSIEVRETERFVRSVIDYC